MKLYNISFRSDLPTIWKPKDVEGNDGDVNNIFTEPSTPRICLSPTLEQCFKAIYPNISKFFEIENYPYMVFNVYQAMNIDNKFLIYPNTLTEKRWVLDAHLTKEHWYLNNLKMANMGKIKINNTNRSKMIKGHPFDDVKEKEIELFPKNICIQKL